MEIPTTLFNGTLRQIAAASLGDTAVAVLNACAPWFLVASEDRTEQERNKIRANLPSNTNLYVTRRQFRRYSGDCLPDALDEHRLDAGCYFSICRDSTGFDHGTLVNELNAYRSSELDYYVQFLDGLNKVEADALRLPISTDIQVVIAHPGELIKALDPSAHRSLILDLEEADKRGMKFRVPIPSVITHRRIDGVLDLRQLHAQRWFFSRYVRRRIAVETARSFTDILPELLNPRLGGSQLGANMKLQEVGVDLRNLGVAGLIFPSARSDVSVSYVSQALVDSQGWNLLIYKHRPPREFAFIDAEAWKTEFWHPQISVEENEGLLRHGWLVKNLQSFNAWYYHVPMAKRRILPAHLMGQGG